MSDCPTDVDIMEQNDKVPNTYDADRQEVTTRQMDEEFNQEVDKLTRAGLEQQVSQESATATAPTGETPSRRDMIMARAMANQRSQRFTELGLVGRDKLVDAFETTQKLVDGTSVVDATAWMNIQNKMNKWFVNKRNDMNHWLAQVADIAGRMAYQNPLVQTFNGLIPKIRGVNGIFISRHQKWERALEPYAARTGHSRKVLGEAVGHYLNCLHTPEDNAHLLEGWKRQRDALEEEYEEYAQAMTRGEKLSAKEQSAMDEINSGLTLLDKKIADLETYIDDPNPPEGIFSCGYTNGQARVRMAQIERDYEMTPEELRQAARGLSDEFNFITEELAKAGLVPPEQLAAIPDFEWYTPMMTREANMVGVQSDATMYLPNSYHAAEGRTTTPDSGYTSLGFMARRAATEIGMQPFGQALWGLWMRQERTKLLNPEAYKDIGLRCVDDAWITKNQFSTDPRKQAAADALRKYNGFSMNVPIAGEMKRRYFYFDTDWKSGTLNGTMLNEALSSNYKLGNAFTEFLKTATSYYGQSFTRFSPGFAPVGAFRDLMERGMHLLSRDFYSADGTVVHGSEIIGKYLTSLPRATTMLFQALRGKAPEGSRTAQLWREYREEGLFQKFMTSQREEPKTYEQLAGEGSKLSQAIRNFGFGKWADTVSKGEQFKPMMRTVQMGGNAGRAAMRHIDFMNDWIQNIPSFMHYITLREKGVKASDAAMQVRDIMDMTQSGTVAEYLSCIAPFVRPTAQGALAFGRSMGLGAKTPGEIIKEGKKGYLATLGAGLAFSVLYPAIREMFGTDEQGNSYFDAMPVSRVTNALPIPTGDDGSYFKLPQGFGAIRVASAMSLCMDRVWRGIMTPEDGAYEVLFALGRDTIPGNNPAFNFKDDPAKFLMQYFCPAPIKPLLEASQNTNYWGGRIYSDSDVTKALADQGRKTTPAAWHHIAKYMLKEHGLDLAPETYQHVMKGMAGGPVKLITSAIVNFTDSNATRMGWHKPTAMEEMTPFLGTLGGTLWYGKVRSPTMTHFYEAKREIDKEIKRLGIDTKKDGERGEAGEALVKQKLLDGGVAPDRVDDIMLLRNIDAELRRQGMAFSKKHSRWYDEDDGETLKADFHSLFEANMEQYDRFMRESNYYRNWR